jgi:uncharacterized membrane protein
MSPFSRRTLHIIGFSEGLLIGLSILLFGLITGFFYAYSSSVMFGLDASNPHIAIAAMQGINREVRNFVFAPAFFGAPVVAIATFAFLYYRSKRIAALTFLLAAVVYVGAAMMPTFLINVPMNNELARVVVPQSDIEAKAIWDAYSSRWTWWNGFRGVASALSLLFCAYGLGRAVRNFGLLN